MANEVYVVGRVTAVNQAYVELSKEEKAELGKKMGAVRDEAGGEAVLRLTSLTSCFVHFIDKYPSLDAWTEAQEKLFATSGLYIKRYWQFEIDLCRA